MNGTVRANGARHAAHLYLGVVTWTRPGPHGVASRGSQITAGVAGRGSHVCDPRYPANPVWRAAMIVGYLQGFEIFTCTSTLQVNLYFNLTG